MKKPSNPAAPLQGREKLKKALQQSLKNQPEKKPAPPQFNGAEATARMIQQYQAEIGQREKEIDARRERIGYLRGVIDTLRAVTAQAATNGVGQVK